MKHTVPAANLLGVTLIIFNINKMDVYKFRGVKFENYIEYELIKLNNKQLIDREKLGATYHLSPINIK